MNQPLHNILIVGHDIHAWSCALFLRKALKPYKVNITVLSKQRASIETGVITFGTSAHQFHRAVGIAEVDLIKVLNGAYNYGIRYNGIGNSSNNSFVFGYSPCGRMINRVPFHHYVSRAELSGKSTSLHSFSLCAAAAEQNRFSHPEPNTDLELIDYTLNVDQRAYHDFVRSMAIRAGVQHITDDIVSVQKDVDTDVINEVQLVSGESLSVDFVFNSSGDSAFDKNSDANFESWSPWFPFDRKATLLCHSDQPTPVLRSVQSLSQGIHQCSAMPGAIEHKMLFDSNINSDDEIITLLTSLAAGAPVSPTHLTRIQPGSRQSFWSGNCVTIGDATGFAGELMIDQLHFTHYALQRWIDSYPSKPISLALAHDYNRQTHMEYERVRDVHALIIKAICGDIDSANWPESLLHRIALFEATGRTPFYESDVLDKNQWAAMLMGCGIRAQRYDPLINRYSDSELNELLSSMAAEVDAIVAKFPPHDALLNAIRSS